MNNGRGIPNQMTRQYDDLSMNLGHTAMSYRCSFCKRDFSNAQALGGHMNIHRKDRAKLKEFSDENLFSLDIFKTVDFVGENSLVDPDPFTSGETKKAANSCDDLQDVVATSKYDLVRRSLALFAETTSISDEYNLEKNNMGLIHGEVDLELRLGP